MELCDKRWHDKKIVYHTYKNDSGFRELNKMLQKKL